MNKKNSFILVLLFIVIFIGWIIQNDKVKSIKNKIYTKEAKYLKTALAQSIKDKQNSTLVLALTLSKNKIIKDYLTYKKQIDMDILKKLFLDLRKFSKFKNVWFHIIDKNGNSVYRSWSNQQYDNIINSRKDIKKVLKNKNITSTISVGKYDMTFKSIIPIFDKNKFIGIFEVITHFNSIAKYFEQKKIDTLFLVDKSYKKQILYPFTKKFIKNYYIANLNAKDKYIKILSNDIDMYIKQKKDYFIDEKNRLFFAIYYLKDIENKKMGYVFLFKNLKDIHTKEADFIKNNFILITIFILVTIIWYLYYLNLDKKNQEIKELLQLFDIGDFALLKWVDNNDGNWNLVYLSKNVENIFGYSKEQFISKEIDFLSIIKEDDRNRIIDTIQEAIILEKPYIKHDPFKIVKKDGNVAWLLGFDLIIYEKDHIKHIGYFYDITELKQKDLAMFEQAKLASLGEMIGNIAHQWRQPLSVISTAATGLGFQAELGIIEADMVKDNCEKINTNAQYLSKTIDDFRNFIRGNRVLEEFYIDKFLNEILNIINPIIKDNDIKLVIKERENFKAKGYKNELIQIIINIINNSKDVFKEKNITNRMIFLDIYKNGDKLFISIKDNGGGVPDDIKDKIFEPYFTTKHQSIGTGLGLSMSYKLVTEGMNGEIKEENVSYEYNGVSYKGANFIIIVPV